MRFIKVVFALGKIPSNLWGAILLFYLKKIFFIKVNDKDANIKKITSCIIETNGKIESFTERNVNLTFKIEQKTVKLNLRNLPYSDVGILHELLVQKEYERLFFLTQNSPNTLSTINIIDAGSNIGLFTLLAKLHFPDSKIALVEPDADAITQFHEMAKLNNLTNCYVFKNGLLNISELNVNISEGIRGPGNAGFVIEKSNKQSTLKSINLKDIISASNFEAVFILKLDIEGAEQDVILGDNFDEVLAQKIQYIAIEIHDDQVDRTLIENRLNQLNFTKIDSNRVDVFKNIAFNS